MGDKVRVRIGGQCHSETKVVPGGIKEHQRSRRGRLITTIELLFSELDPVVKTNSNRGGIVNGSLYTRSWINIMSI